MDFIVVFVTVPDKETADKILRSLLEKRLCACVNLIKDIDSFFWWQAKIDNQEEILLVAKTRKSLFSRLEEEVKILHPYKVPEIVGFNLDCLNRDYAEWLEKETNKDG